MNKDLFYAVTKEYCRNILYVCKRCSITYIKEGLSWYANTYFICKELSERYSLSINTVAGVISALSPAIRWHRNLEVARQLLEIYSTNKMLENISVLGVYGKRNFDKAISILKGEDPLQVLGGNKVRAFYNCISNTFSNQAPVVVLDRHAVSIAVGHKLSDKYIKYISTAKKYEILANAYIKVAEMVGMLPHQLQAMVWCKWRDYYAGL